MKVLIQPEDGAKAIVRAINAAKSSVEIFIFRFDQREIERALANAVQRRCMVHALIAHLRANSGVVVLGVRDGVARV